MHAADGGRFLVPKDYEFKFDGGCWYEYLCQPAATDANRQKALMKPYYTKLEDGSVIVEWVSPDVRFGINIELNSEASGWFYVTKDMSKNESGLLPPELQSLLTKRAVDKSH